MLAGNRQSMMLPTVRFDAVNFSEPFVRFTLTPSTTQGLQASCARLRFALLLGSNQQVFLSPEFSTQGAAHGSWATGFSPVQLSEEDRDLRFAAQQRISVNVPCIVEAKPAVSWAEGTQSRSNQQLPHLLAGEGTAPNSSCVSAPAAPPVSLGSMYLQQTQPSHGGQQPFDAGYFLGPFKSPLPTSAGPNTSAANHSLERHGLPHPSHSSQPMWSNRTFSLREPSEESSQGSKVFRGSNFCAPQFSASQPIPVAAIGRDGHSVFSASRTYSPHTYMPHPQLQTSISQGSLPSKSPRQPVHTSPGSSFPWPQSSATTAAQAASLAAMSSGAATTSHTVPASAPLPLAAAVPDGASFFQWSSDQLASSRGSRSTDSLSQSSFGDSRGVRASMNTTTSHKVSTQFKGATARALQKKTQSLDQSASIPASFEGLWPSTLPILDQTDTQDVQRGSQISQEEADPRFAVENATKAR